METFLGKTALFWKRKWSRGECAVLHSEHLFGVWFNRSQLGCSVYFCDPLWLYMSHCLWETPLHTHKRKRVKRQIPCQFQWDLADPLKCLGRLRGHSPCIGHWWSRLRHIPWYCSYSFLYLCPLYDYELQQGQNSNSVLFPWRQTLHQVLGGGGLVPQLCLTLATPWTVAHQVLLSMGFFRQGYWSGLPFPSLGDLPNPGIKHGSPALQADSLHELYNK